jgi:sialic acid synthase SpsE
MMPKTIRIGKHVIGGREPFIVAEAGINHNGDVRKALRMIALAKKCGVSAVKFQTYKAEEICADTSQMYTYRSQGKVVKESMLAMFKRCEFTTSQWQRIKKECDKQNITFLSTPQNRSDLDLLLTLGIPAIKVGSDDFVNTPLLMDFAKTKLPIILSCGMSDLKEIKETLTKVGAFRGYPIILLLCTSEYPAPPDSLNLNRLRTLRQEFPSILLGLSDHSEGPLASALAASLGGCVFEKHFTLDRDLPGPDHWFSEDPKGLKVWVDSIRSAYRMLGDPAVRPTAKEARDRKNFRRYLVAARAIQKGERYSSDNVVARRIGGLEGLAAACLPDIQGKKAHKNYAAGQPVGV